MVALNENFAPRKPALGSKNRVGNFFGGVAVRAGENRPATRNRIGEKRPTLTIIASGRPVWPSRDPIGENGGLNLYHFVWNNPFFWYDSLGQRPGPPSGGGRGGYRPSPNRSGSNTPPRPDGYPGFPSTFRHHGNWGGPGWANGGWNPEDGHLPGPGDDDYVEPEGERDACYEGHDRCINACPDCPEDERSDCIEDCDHDLSDCLYDLNNPLLWPEALMFDTLIPWLVH